MKLQKLSIKNYKSLKDIDCINFDDLTTIIGENDSGKTSIIEFIEIMLTNNIPDESEYGKYPGYEENKEIEGTVEFILSQEEINILDEYLSNDKKLVIKKIFSKGSVYQTSIKTTLYKDERFNIYKSMKSKELIELLEAYELEPKRNNELRIQIIEEYLQTNEVEVKEGWKMINFNEIKDYLPTIIKYGIDDYINPNNLIYKTLKLKFNDILYEKDSNGKKIFKNSNLQEIINDIQDKINKVSKELLPIARKINPSIREMNLDVDIDLSNGLKSAPITIIDESGVERYLDNFGQGTKKRMCMSIMEWEDNFINDNENIIKIYDEPDNNLHIEAQRKLFKTIKNNCEKKGQAIICTHSPFIMDVSPIKSIRLAQRDEEGITSIDYIKYNDDNEVKVFIDNMCKELGISNSHIFLEKCFFIVEGESEINFFPIVYKYLFNSTLLEDGISLINLKGNGSALNFLKLLVDNKQEEIVLVVDKDSININEKTVVSKLKDMLSTEQAKRFYESNIIYIGDKEFEDCFEDDYIAYILNESKYRKSNNELWKPEEVNENRASDKFSDSIIKMVNVYMKSNGRNDFITKPVLGTLLAEYIDIKYIPQDIIDVINRIRNVAGVEECIFKETNYKEAVMDNE